jgi:hypothetical protein
LGKTGNIPGSEAAEARRTRLPKPIGVLAMSDMSAAVNSSVNSVSGTMELFARAARDGAADAREAASRVMSGTGMFLSRILYTSTYTISYGLVFPVALVAQSIPRENAAVRGFIEGAHAASRRADAMLGRS